MDCFELFDEALYPMTHLYDPVRDEMVRLEDVRFEDIEFGDDFWSTDHIPAADVNIKDILLRMDEIERPYKEARADLQHTDGNYNPPKKRSCLPSHSDKFSQAHKKKKRKGMGWEKRKIKQTISPDVFEVEHIISHKGEWKDLTTMLFRVRWRGYQEMDDTWEPYSNLDGCRIILDRYRTSLTESLYLEQEALSA